MEWVFIALVVVVVAAVVMVAVGRGDGLAPAIPDRPDVELPTGRPLTAADLADLRLSVTVRGYRMDEVDALLARLAAEIADRDAPRDHSRDAHRSLREDPGPRAGPATGAVLASDAVQERP